MLLLVFLWQIPIQESHPNYFTWPSTFSQGTPPKASSAASSTAETEESERDDTHLQIERLREELQNFVRLKE